MEKSYIDFIYEFERDCNDLSCDTVSRLCKRAIKKMNKLEPTLAGSSDDYPSSFSFFDILSVELQSKYYDEINPCLQNYVEGILVDEFDNLPLLERFVLEHSECAVNLECDIEAVHVKIFHAFYEMLNAQWLCKKIQRFEEKRW